MERQTARQTHQAALTVTAVVMVTATVIINVLMMVTDGEGGDDGHGENGDADGGRSYW